MPSAFFDSLDQRNMHPFPLANVCTSMEWCLPDSITQIFTGVVVSHAELLSILKNLILN